MQSPLLSLARPLPGALWPPERVVMGLRVCKQLHSDIPKYAPEVLLKVKQRRMGKNVSVAEVLQEQARYPFNQYEEQASRLEADRQHISNDMLIWDQRMAVVLQCRQGYPPDGLAALLAEVQHCRGSLTAVDLGGCIMNAEEHTALLESIFHASCQANRPMHSICFSSARLHGPTFERLTVTIARLPHLTSLNLCRNGWGADFAGELATLLRALTALVDLDLGYNDLGDGLPLVLDSLPHITRLRNLSLDSVGMTSGRAGKLADVLTANHTSTLKRLSMGGNVYIPSLSCGRHIARIVKHCTALGELSISGCRLDTGGFELIAEELAHTSALSHLELMDCRIHALDWAKFTSLIRDGGCSGLVFLNVSSNSLDFCTAWEMSRGFPQLARLQRLVLSNNRVDDTCARSLAANLRGLSNLRALDLSHNLIGQQGITELMGPGAWHSLITELTLSFNPLGFAGLSALAAAVAKCKNLDQLKLNHVQSRRGRAAGDAGHMLAAMLTACDSLKVVAATENHIRDEGAASVAAVLNGCHALEDLDLEDNRITATGALAFRGVKCTSLTSLTLDWNHIDIGTFRELALALGPTLIGGTVARSDSDDSERFLD